MDESGILQLSALNWTIVFEGKLSMLGVKVSKAEVQLALIQFVRITEPWLRI